MTTSMSIRSSHMLTLPQTKKATKAEGISREESFTMESKMNRDDDDEREGVHDKDGRGLNHESELAMDIALQNSARKNNEDEERFYSFSSASEASPRTWGDQEVRKCNLELDNWFIDKNNSFLSTTIDSNLICPSSK